MFWRDEIETKILKINVHHLSTYQSQQVLPDGNCASLFFQPKLTINQSNDSYEQEADAVADKVMRMTDNDIVQAKFFKPVISPVQRKCDHCEEEEKKLSRKEAKREEITTNSGLESYVDNLNGSGLPLSNEVRNFYEPRLGYDFSTVKVHADTLAAKSAQSINALAYTSGNNIVFNQGQYSPDTDNGKKLLAHELTHVIQQSSASRVIRKKDNGQEHVDVPAIPATAPASAVPAAAPAGPVVPEQFTVTEESKTNDMTTIFFDRHSHTINLDESLKILFLAGPPDAVTGRIELKGFVSDDEPATLAQERITAVKNEFLSYTGFTGTFMETPRPTAGLGRVNYRRVRSVEMVVPRAKSKNPNCDTTASKINCSARTENNFQSDVIEARRKITRADKLLSAATRTAETNTLLGRFFGKGIPGDGAAVLSTVLSNMALIREQIWRVRDKAHHPCANECDSVCDAGAIAYNSGDGNNATYTLCPPFDVIDGPNRIRNVIHECAHGTPNLSKGTGPAVPGTDDFAYRFERMIDMLEPSVALVNSDSYALLIMFLNDPDFSTQQPGVDDTSAITDPVQKQEVELATANAQKWVTFGQQETSSLYGVINKSKPPATTWSNTYYEETMKIWASNFSEITMPPALPNNMDQMIVAGIYDRVNALRKAFRQDIIFTRLPMNTSWNLNLGEEVNIGDDFFALSNPEAKSLLLLQKVVHSNIDIPSTSEAGYVDAIDKIRKRH